MTHSYSPDNSSLLPESSMSAGLDMWAEAKSRLIDYLHSASYAELAAIAVGLLWLSSFFGPKHPTVPGAKVFGYRSFFEPTFFVQVRFVFSAHDIISNAYEKLKNVPFVLRRYDTDITVLPMKYLDEMRLIPRHKLNGKKAQVNNLVPKWTWTEVMMDSDLHVKVLNGKLNPNLPKYMQIAESELEYGWGIDIPKLTNEWTEVDVQESMRMLVARMSAKIFMGDPACRDPEWLRISIDFTYDMFLAAFTMRMFPPWMHPIVAHFVPARWRLRRQMRAAKRIVGGLMREHREAKKSGNNQDTLLGWMVDNGDEKETSISEMAARQCVLTLASIHTTSMSVSNMLFDLCAHPEWFSVLTEEIDEAVAKYGMLGRDAGMNPKQWLQTLEKMDSFFVESQRINPPILLNPQRIALVPLKLKDGTEIPKGARVAFAGHHHANDPRVAPNPEVFDPMRSYRRRHSGDNANLTKFTAGMTNSDSLSFGYGGQACPGRYFAVGEIKMVMARLLSEFEFKLPDGKPRPSIMYADENVFMDPSAKLMMRRRTK